MKKYNIVPLKLKSKKHRKKGDEGKPHSGIPNIIKTICPLTINVIWSSDFTYIPYKGSFIFLCTVIDIYTREILGAQVSKNHNARLVFDALVKALYKRGTSPLILHSDQGSEYTGNLYKNIVKSNNISFSNSAKASPWENGYQESFYSQFKEELEDPNKFNTIPELIEAIYRQLHYYNNKRIHTSLKTTPVNYRLQAVKNITKLNKSVRRLV